MSKIKQHSSEDLKEENKDLAVEIDQNLHGKGESRLLKMIEQFSTKVLLTNSIIELVDVIVENAQLLNQQVCLIYEYDKTRQTLQSLNKSVSIETPRTIPFNDALIIKRECFFLKDVKDISKALSIGLNNAIVGSLFKSDGSFQGFIICGNTEEDKSINSELLSLFSIMTNVVSLRFESLKNNELIEEERKYINAQLKRSNEDLEQFAYIISHDLKAPLRNIKSFAQLLKKMYRNQLDGDGVTFLDFITGGVSKFDNLIDDLLQYSRVSRRAMPFEKIDLNEIIQDVILSTYITASKDDVEIKSQKLPTIFGNAHRVEQLLQNLVDNAVKFKQASVKAKIHIKVKKEKEFIQLSITDNGIGIEKQYSERIFQLFQKLHADSEYKGTGLGLSICRKIVERHKGKIWMESNGLDKGTTFYVLLPEKPANA